MDTETKQCQNCKNNFTIESEDFDFYKKIDVPPPTFCPECRNQRRLAFRNERFMYKIKSPFSGKDIFSMYTPLSGKKVVDLGSGDGRIMIAYAKSGASVRGYEINPLLVIAARNNIRKAGLQFKAQAYWKSFWNQNLSDADIVTIFGVPHIMASLEKKLQTELKPGARIFSIAFPFPHWPLEYHEENIYYYKRL